MFVVAQAPGAAQVSFAAAASTAAAALGVFNVIAGEPGAGAQLSLSAPGSNRLNGQSFRVRVSGFVTLAAGTYTALQVATLFASKTAGFTAASGNAIYTATAAAISVAQATPKVVPWSIEALCEGDNGSGALQGTALGLNNGSLQAQAAIGQAPTSVDYSAEPPLQFACGVSVGGSNQYPVNGATANLTQLQIES